MGGPAVVRDMLMLRVISMHSNICEPNQTQHIDCANRKEDAHDLPYLEIDNIEPVPSFPSQPSFSPIPLSPRISQSQTEKQKFPTPNIPQLRHLEAQSSL